MKTKFVALTILSFLFTLVLAGCKTVEPKFYNEPIKVGYKEKYQYWQAYKKYSVSGEEKSVRNKLYESGGIIFYQYLIDSNGNAWGLQLMKTVPANLISQRELEESQLVYGKFRATASNTEKQTVRVFERLVFQKDSRSMAIPPDGLSDEEVVEQFGSWAMGKQGEQGK